jgi:hypothetical protein
VPVTLHLEVNSRVNRTLNGIPISYPPGKGQNETRVVPLFRNSLIRTQAAHIVIIFDKPDRSAYRGFNLVAVTGTSDHTTFEIYFRFIYSAFAVASIWYLRRTVQWARLSAWSLEQKLTFPLLVLAPLSNNPLYILHCYHPRFSVFVVDAFATPLFHAVIYFDVLVILYRILNKSAMVTSQTLLPHAALAACCFVFECAGKIVDLPLVLSGKPQKGTAKWLCTGCEYAVNIAFSVWVLFAMSRAARSVDVTEKFKLYWYFVTCAVILFQSLGILVIIRGLGLFKLIDFEWVGVFSCVNVFTLMMAYFHWPYESERDGTYQHGRGALINQQILEPAEDIDEEEDKHDDKQE